MSGKLFVLYDGRAKGGDTDEASVYVSAVTEAEARRDGKHYKNFQDGIWYQYDSDEKGNLSNERPRWDLPPTSKGEKK